MGILHGSVVWEDQINIAKRRSPWQKKKAIIILIIFKSKTFMFTYLYFLAFANMSHLILMMFPLAPYLKSLCIVC